MFKMDSRVAEGFSHLSEQWPYLRYLGMGAWWAWIWLCYSGTGLYAYWPLGSFAGHVGLMYLASTPAIMVSLLLGAAFWRRVTCLLARPGFTVGMSLLATVGTIAIAMTPLVGIDWLFPVGGVLTGVGTSILALRTGQTYGTLGGREVLTAGSASLIVASFLYFMGTGIPLAWQPIFIAASPPSGRSSS